MPVEIATATAVRTEVLRSTLPTRVIRSADAVFSSCRHAMQGDKIPALLRCVRQKASDIPVKRCENMHQGAGRRSRALAQNFAGFDKPQINFFGIVEDALGGGQGKFAVEHIVDKKAPRVGCYLSGPIGRQKHCARAFNNAFEFG